MSVTGEQGSWEIGELLGKQLSPSDPLTLTRPLNGASISSFPTPTPTPSPSSVNDPGLQPLYKVSFSLT